MRENDAYLWYRALEKPDWAPPSWLFGPVWTVLYLVIVVTFGAVFLAAYRKALPMAVALPFLLNLIANFAFTPLQFWLRSNVLAAIDIVLVLATLVWALVAIWPHMRMVAYANLPYLAWVSFATVLQLTITYLNAR